jgi:hypothetical protein
MTKNKTILITVRMDEEQVSLLDAMLNRGETRSAGIRRILYNAWADMREAQEKKQDTRLSMIAETVCKGDKMTAFIDTLISASLIAGVMLIGVLASAVYEAIQGRKSK